MRANRCRKGADTQEVILRDVYGEKKKGGDAINTIIDSLSLEDLKEFLRREFKEDPKLKIRLKIYFADRVGGRSIEDYRKEINLLCGGTAGEYEFTKHGDAEADFTQIQDLAEHLIQKGNLREAAKIYQALSELTLSATKAGRFLLLAHREPSKQWVCHHPVNTPFPQGNGVYVGTLMGAASCLAS